MRTKERQVPENEKFNSMNTFQLKYLWVKDFYKLKNFDIRINSNVAVLIGENGSGKSTVIECLADIFGHLYKYFVLNDLTAEFINDYKIEYGINGRVIYIESHYSDSDTNTFAPIITIDGATVDMVKTKSQRKDFGQYLPSKIVMSYSGISKQLYQLNKHFEDKYIAKLIDTKKNYSLIPLNLPEENPFIYIKDEYVEFIALALMTQDSEAAKKLLNKIGINVNNCSITITIKKPSWAKSNQESIYPWGIRGKVATDFIDGLNRLGTLKEKNIKNQYQYIFYGANDIQTFFDFFALSSGQVLGFFDTLLCDDLLDSVQISWKQDNVELTLARLSEGEKQLLLSEGLCTVLNQKNLLLLMDEPDVSLHPKWQREFIPHIRETWIQDAMAVITTHSPNIVSSLKTKELLLIRDGRIVTKGLNYIGKTAEDILIEFFDLPSTRSIEAENLINNVWDEIKHGSIDSEEFKQLLEQLTLLIGRDDEELCAINLGIIRRQKANAQDK